MLKNRRALSAVIGGVFMMIMMSTSITYTAVSMNQVAELAETVADKQVTDYEQFTEEYEVVTISIADNQFNMTVKNTGDIPVHLNRLWVENTTSGSTWLPGKFELDLDVGSGQTVTNIGQNIGLTALDTQSYMMSLISDRGNAENIFLNSVGEESLYLQLHAFPTTISDGFTSVLILEVVNNGTTKLLNLQPNTMPSPSTSCTGSCSVTEVSGPIPSSYPSLDPGNTVQFEWVYEIYGTDTGDAQTFAASLVNGVDTATATITVQTVDTAENANISLISGGLGDQEILGRDVLIFHEETTVAASGTQYQMYSGAPDGGSSGDTIVLDNETPHFITNNGSNTITVPGGDWEFALMLSSDAVGDSVNSNYDMIFHFEDGDDVDPDNSQGSASRDLTGCGASIFNQEIETSNRDAYEKHNGDVSNDSNDLLLALDNGGNNERIVGVKFDSVDIVEDTEINTAYLIFNPREDDSQTTNLRIYGELPSDGDADNFTEDDDDITDRTLITAYVDWFDVAAWVDNEINSGTTPNLAPIIEEIVADSNWDSGNDLVIIIFDHPDKPSDGQRKAESEDADHNPATTLTINYGVGAAPDWQDNTGPHASGSYLFNGVDECFRSTLVVDEDDGNNLDDGDSTTSLWFKTTDGGMTPAHITEEMYLINWDDGETCPACEHYRISMLADSTAQSYDGGQIQFSYDPQGDPADPIVCTSSGTYDDNTWYFVVASRDGSGDECTLNIMNVDGTDAENTIFVNSDNDSDEINVDGTYWNVGSNQAEDGNFFKGYIDDVMHWDDNELSPGDKDDLGRTNYGDAAHTFDVTETWA